MTKELKDRAWAAIPPQARAEARREFEFYFRKGKYDATTVLDHIFGGYNLTSDTEPEEVLCCPRKRVQELYNEANSYGHADTLYRQGVVRALKDLFYDKCLPDPSEPKPTPTEPEPQQTEETMEEKELNLAELLLKYNADKIYLVDEGEVELVEIIDKLAVDVKGVDGRPIGLRGETLEIKPTGFAYIYPSKESFLKYPLNAKQAWQIWAEERKPTYTVHVKVSGFYGDKEITEGAFTQHVSFRTESEMQKAMASVGFLLDEYQKNTEK